MACYAAALTGDARRGVAERLSTRHTKQGQPSGQVDGMREARHSEHGQVAVSVQLVAERLLMVGSSSAAPCGVGDRGEYAPPC